MLTRSQIVWASRHDWFIADNGDGTIAVRDCYFDAGNAYHEEVVQWDRSFRELLGWAGY